MSSLQARTGRHRQLYDNNFRLVSGCIPYKLTKGNEFESNHFERTLKVLMISTPNRSDLVFPKGGWEDDETVEEAACREAWEEAGVKGILIEKPLGDWVFKSKSNQDKCGLEGACRGRMFALEVTEEPEVWPEKDKYHRKWLNVSDAYRLCRYDWMREALKEFSRVMEERTHETKDVASESNTASTSVAAERRITSPGCNLKSSSSQHIELLIRCSISTSCKQPVNTLGATGTTTSSTQLNLKGTA